MTSKIIKYTVVFFAGAVSYQVALFFIFGFPVEVPSENRFSLQTEYLRDHTQEVCKYLDSVGCECKAKIETTASCQTQLSDFIRNKIETEMLPK